MAEDVRESILSRIAVVLGGITAASEVVRNELLTDDTSRKRIVLMDGAETVAESEELFKRSPGAARVARMYPVVVTTVVAKSADIGSANADLRGKIINAIETDATLAGLTSNGRGARYIGLDAEMMLGVLNVDQVPLKFAINYVLRPTQFA